MPLDFTDDKSALVQVMAWCHQATSHYLSQCWPRFLLPYGVTRPRWVNLVLLECSCLKTRTVNTLRPDQNGWHFIDNFSNELSPVLHMPLPEPLLTRITLLCLYFSSDLLVQQNQLAVPILDALSNLSLRQDLFSEVSMNFFFSMFRTINIAPMMYSICLTLWINLFIFCSILTKMQFYN